MKLTFKIHESIQAVEGGGRALGKLIALRPIDLAGDGAALEPITEFPSERIAELTLVDALKRGDMLGVFADYIVQAYDDAGYPVERVADAEQALAAADAQYLTKHDIEVRTAVASLTAARQLYALVITEVGRLPADKAVPAPEAGTDAKRPPHPLVSEVLAQASANSAAKPFSSADLFEGLTHVVLPWVKTVIERAAAAQIDDNRQRLAEAETARRSLTIPAPLPVSRDRPLVLIGWGPALRYVLDRWTETILAARNEQHPQGQFCVIRFCDADRVPPAEDEYLALVGRDGWDRCTRSPAALQRTVTSHLQSQLTHMPDVLVIDDLPAAADGIEVKSGQRRCGISPYRASEAVRKLRKWREHTGLALLAGVNGPVGPISLSGKEWDALKQQADVRQLFAERLGGQWRITVEGSDWAATVDEASLTLPEKKLILP